MLNTGEIKWVKIKYRDSSLRVFRATIDTSIIRDISGKIPDREIYNEDKTRLERNYLFDVKNEVVVEIPDTAFVSYSDTKPSFDREVDKYANSFI